MRDLQWFKENPKYHPTAVPRSGFCPQCRMFVYSREWTWCGVHFEWEDPRHMSEFHGKIIAST